jgi:hypothetical protein
MRRQVDVVSGNLMRLRVSRQRRSCYGSQTSWRGFQWVASKELGRHNGPFGIALNAEAGAVLASASAGANYKVTMAWKRSPS